MKVAITGGAGYIGSTIASACLDAGIAPVIIDNLSAGRFEFAKGRHFYRGDVADGALIDQIWMDHTDIAAVVHCAALIVVPDSLADPLKYYRENVAKTIDLLGHLRRNGCKRFIYSSSASVYQPNSVGWVDERSPIAPMSPYAQSKAIVERILADLAGAENWNILSLRYFNPIGADPELRTGAAQLRPTHVLGKLLDAHHSGTPFEVHGTDWPTRDGTTIRDYIHVWDLARAHVAAAEALVGSHWAGREPYEVVNIGSGNGTTVRELLAAFEGVVGQPLAAIDGGRRPGDVVGCYTGSDRAKQLLGWQPHLNVTDGIRHAVAWSRTSRDRRHTGVSGSRSSGFLFR